jgi:hypothetical protein
MTKKLKQNLSEVDQIFRRFLYLDGDAVLNALAGLQGGDVTSILESSLKVFGGSAGLGFSIMGAGINFGGKSRRDTTREVHLRQTVHSAVSVLLDKLYDGGGIGLVTSQGTVAPAHENKVIQAEAAISIPERKSVAVPSRWAMPLRSRRAREFQALQESTSDGLVASASLAASTAASPDAMLLALRGKYLLADTVAEFGRLATLVGQVALVAGDDEELYVERESASGEVAVLRPLTNGASTTKRVLVRPFCIFR